MFITINEMKSKMEGLYRSGELEKIEAFGDMTQDYFNKAGKDYKAKFRLLADNAEQTDLLLQYITVLEFTESIGYKEINLEELLEQMKNKIFKNGWNVNSHIIYLMMAKHIPFSQIVELLNPVLDTIKPVKDKSLISAFYDVQTTFIERKKVVYLSEIDEKDMELARKDLQRYL